MPANSYYETGGVQFAPVTPNLTPALSGMQPLRFGAGVSFQPLNAWVVPEPKPYIAQGIEKGISAISQGMVARDKNKREDAKDAEAKARFERQQNWNEYSDYEKLKMQQEEHDLKMAKERSNAVSSKPEEIMAAFGMGGTPANKPTATPADTAKTEEGQTDAEKQAGVLADTKRHDLFTGDSAADASRGGGDGAYMRDASRSAFQAQGLDLRPPSRFVKPASIDIPVKISDQMTIAGQPVERPSQLTQMQLLEPKKPTTAFFEQSMDLGEGALSAPATSALANIDAKSFDPKNDLKYQKITPMPADYREADFPGVTNVARDPQGAAWQVEDFPVNERYVGTRAYGKGMPSTGGRIRVTDNPPSIGFFDPKGTTVNTVPVYTDAQRAQIRQRNMAALMGINPEQAQAALMGIQPPARPVATTSSPAPAPRVPGAPDTGAASADDVERFKAARNQSDADRLKAASDEPPQAPGAPAQAPGAAQVAQARPASQYRDIPIESMYAGVRNLRSPDTAQIIKQKLENEPTMPWRISAIAKSPDPKTGVYHVVFERKDAPAKFDAKLENYRLRAKALARAGMVAAETQVNRNQIIQDFASKGGPVSSIDLLMESYAKASDPKSGSKTFFDNDMIQIVAKMARGATPTENEIHLILSKRSVKDNLESYVKGKFTGDILTQAERDKIASLATEVYNLKSQKANEEVVRYRMRWANEAGFENPMALPAYFAGGSGVDLKMMLKSEADQEIRNIGSQLSWLEEQKKTASGQKLAEINSRQKLLKHEGEALTQRIKEAKNDHGVYLKPKRPRDGHFSDLIGQLKDSPRTMTEEDLHAERAFSEALLNASKFGDQSGGVYIEPGT